MRERNDMHGKAMDGTSATEIDPMIAQLANDVRGPNIGIGGKNHTVWHLPRESFSSSSHTTLPMTESMANRMLYKLIACVSLRENKQTYVNTFTIECNNEHWSRSFSIKKYRPSSSTIQSMSSCTSSFEHVVTDNMVRSSCSASSLST